jgi:hypothetical protein
MITLICSMTKYFHCRNSCCGIYGASTGRMGLVEKVIIISSGALQLTGAKVCPLWVELQVYFCITKPFIDCEVSAPESISTMEPPPHQWGFGFHNYVDK